MTVLKTILAPEQLKRGELETLDPEVLNPSLSNKGLLSQISDLSIPLNLTFSEPSYNFNIAQQIKNRRSLAEYCFESLGCSSISFVKQSSVHLYSDLKYNGIVVDLGSEFTQISPVVDGYTSPLSSQTFKVSGSKLDNYLLNRLLTNFNCQQQRDIDIDIVHKYKLKCDLKETSFSPYKIPFNYEMLKQVNKIDINNTNAYKEYVLPEGTMIKLNNGPG